MMKSLIFSLLFVLHSGATLASERGKLRPGERAASWSPSLALIDEGFDDSALDLIYFCAKGDAESAWKAFQAFFRSDATSGHELDLFTCDELDADECVFELQAYHADDPELLKQLMAKPADTAVQESAMAYPAHDRNSEKERHLSLLVRGRKWNKIAVVILTAKFDKIIEQQAPSTMRTYFAKFRDELRRGLPEPLRVHRFPTREKPSN